MFFSVAALSSSSNSSSSASPSSNLKGSKGAHRFFVPLMLGLGIAGLGGCEESKGGFGEGETNDKSGMVHKPLKEAPKPPDFKNAFVLKTRFQKESSEVLATLELKKGFHAYAKGETIGKPVELVVKPTNGWAVDGKVNIPEGKNKDLGDLGKSMILEGNVSISAKVNGGKGPISGVLMVQVCTDTACDRPRPHAFSLPTS